MSDHVENFTREVLFIPAYDHRHGNLLGGAHGVGIIFVLRGPKGAVTFSFSTHWCKRETEWDPQWPSCFEMRYHSRVPLINDEERPGLCGLLNGNLCYSDATYCADKTYWRLVHEGHPGVWLDLGEFYDRYFGQLTLEVCKGDASS